MTAPYPYAIFYEATEVELIILFTRFVIRAAILPPCPARAVGDRSYLAGDIHHLGPTPNFILEPE